MNTEDKNKYKNHFLMNNEDIKIYVVKYLHLFDNISNLNVSEIGDGNINYVHLVVDESTGKSLVVKQADKFLRASGRPLDLSRNKIEADILKLQNELAPAFIPKIYHYDDKMFALTMEDISEYKNMRYALIDQNIYPNFSDEISDFLSQVLLPTTDLVLDRNTKKQRVKSFINIEMCDISEDLVLTEPYNNYKNQNIITKGNENFVKTYLYQNDSLKAEIDWLRNNYMNNSQALLHGDLHTGSIFINQSGLKVIDPEFAFYGPMGYDIGNVLAHLYFPLVLNLFRKDKSLLFEGWLLASIEEVFDKVSKKLSVAYDNTVKLELSQNNAFKQNYLNGILSDSLGYAGTEIIRRVVGDSKVKELSLISDKDKIIAERILILNGVQLIKNREKFVQGKDLVNLFLECKEVF
ncbi:S-methyl-5-thioribose kinase [Enterococcus sp. DIV0086]|uniref:S-methyl-5-thioribose kinase n=1 Tax=Enterococcus sp. DIV0086 TaxID=2774655 RepID=UPI003D2CF717